MAFLVLAAAGRRWFGLEFQATLLVGTVFAAALGWAAAITFAGRPRLTEVAARLDRLGHTRERFVTALALTGSSASPSGMNALALGECLAFLRARSFAPLLPYRIPRELPWLFVPAITLAVLQWDAAMARAQRDAQATAAHAAVADTTHQLEQLARELERQQTATEDEELRKLAEQLQRSAARLRAEREGAEEADKAAFRELSALEEMIRQMQKPPASLSPEEMKELAKALAENEATRKAAQELQTGDLAAAAKALEEAEKQLAESRDPASKEQAEQTLREALERLENSRQLSEAMRQLAKQLQERSGQGQASSTALQQLSQMLKKLAQQAESEGDKDNQSQQKMLQSMLAALQNMKFGEGNKRQQSGASPSDQKSGDGQVVIQSFASSAKDGIPMPGDAQAPSGKPGSDKDFGTTETPFGQGAKAGGEKGADVALKGRLGEGESLSQLLPTAGDHSEAKRRYKELYESMAPAAEDAVVQENIPLGSRFLIKRYFESIRPPE